MPTGNVPSTGSALTGRVSPRPASIVAVVRRDEVERLGLERGTHGRERRAATRRHRDLAEPVERRVDRGLVAIEHRLAALAVRASDRLLDREDRLVERQHAGEREEARLQHGVDATAHARLLRHAGCVDDVEPEPLRHDLLLHPRRQVLPDLVGPEGCVEQERRALGGDVEDVDLLQEAELVAGDEPGARDEVRRADRARPEAEVRHGDRAGLLRVVDEVALGVAVRCARR